MYTFDILATNKRVKSVSTEKIFISQVEVYFSKTSSEFIVFQESSKNKGWHSNWNSISLFLLYIMVIIMVICLKNLLRSICLTIPSTPTISFQPSTLLPAKYLTTAIKVDRKCAKRSKIYLLYSSIGQAGKQIKPTHEIQRNGKNKKHGTSNASETKKTRQQLRRTGNKPAKIRSRRFYKVGSRRKVKEIKSSRSNANVNQRSNSRIGDRKMVGKEMKTSIVDEIINEENKQQAESGRWRKKTNWTVTSKWRKLLRGWVR